MASQVRKGRHATLAMVPWDQDPEILARIEVTYTKWLRGQRAVSIAQELSQDLQMVYRDLQHGRELVAKRAGETMSVSLHEEVARRRTIQSAAFEDRDMADADDAQGRASLLRVAGDQQKAVEELEGLRHKEQGTGGTTINAPTLIQIGTQPPKPIEDCTDDELEIVEGELAK